MPYRYDAGLVREVLHFALQPGLVGIACRHLGLLPVLAGARILYSPNAAGELSNAQLFHTDPEGARQVKMFMAARTVGPENSPFTFIPEGPSLRMLQSGDPDVLVKRVPDKNIARYSPPETWIAHEGGPGDTLLVDTSRCFHFGSRPNSKPRLLFYLSFFDPFSSFFPARRHRPKLGQNWRDYADLYRPNARLLLAQTL